MKYFEKNNPVWDKAFLIYAKTAITLIAAINAAPAVVISAENASKICFWLSVSAIVLGNLANLTTDKNEKSN